MPSCYFQDSKKQPFITTYRPTYSVPFVVQLKQCYWAFSSQFVRQDIYQAEDKGLLKPTAGQCLFLLFWEDDSEYDAQPPTDSF